MHPEQYPWPTADSMGTASRTVTEITAAGGADASSKCADARRNSAVDGLGESRLRRTVVQPPRVDLAGQRFGSYVALRYAGGSAWHCVCDCGTERPVLTSNLLRGHSTSCGCMKPSKSRAAATRHGLADTPIHRAWMSMRQRCQNPNDSAYANYGGRGISVCERWESFENFAADMGPLPPGYEIERNDVNGNYEPSNCRWATKQEQANNKRTSRRITYQGRTQTLAQWADEIGLKRATLYYRIVLAGMPLEEAMRPASLIGEGA